MNHAQMLAEVLLVRIHLLIGLAILVVGLWARHRLFKQTDTEHKVATVLVWTLALFEIVSGINTRCGQNLENAIVYLLNEAGSMLWTTPIKSAIGESNDLEAQRISKAIEELKNKPIRDVLASGMIPTAEFIATCDENVAKAVGKTVEEIRFELQKAEQNPGGYQQRSAAPATTNGGSGYAAATNRRYPADWPVDVCNGTTWPSARCEVSNGGVWYKTGLYLHAGEFEHSKVAQSIQEDALKRLGRVVPVDGIDRDKDTPPFQGLPRGCVVYRVGNSIMAHPLFSLEKNQQEGHYTADQFPALVAGHNESGDVFLALNEWPEDAEGGTGATTVYLEREPVEKIHPDIHTNLPDKDNHKKSKST